MQKTDSYLGFYKSFMKKFLDENRDRLVTNSELANHIYRSPDYSLKLFKREFGTTPYDYQIKNKIHMATSLLQHTKNHD